MICHFQTLEQEVGFIYLPYLVWSLFDLKSLYQESQFD